MFALRAVSKRFESTTVIEDLDLEVAVGRTTALIGPSGCGKTTILRLFLGLIEPDAGEVLFDGSRVEARSLRTVRRAVGYVVQGGGLFPHLAARDDAALVARLEGWSAERVADRIAELGALLRLPDDVWDRHPSEISGGQRQRVALARALFRSPRALLLDEPLGALDPMVRMELQEDLREIFAGLRTTVVFVTHDMGEAAYLGDEIILLRDGAIAARGDLEQVLASTEPWVRRFLRAQRGVATP